MVISINEDEILVNSEYLRVEPEAPLPAEGCFVLELEL